MGLYKLRTNENDLESGVMERVTSEDIDYEKDFENWLENSPSVLLDDDEGSTVLWIGRQVTASVGDTGKYPDLLGIDADGDLVIVELKKGRTPRDVIAQILEYASWGASLTYDDLNQIAMQYFNKSDTGDERTLEEAYKEVFCPGDESILDVQFNKKQKLYIIAEDVSSIVRQVASYLRSNHGVDIHCLQYQVYKTGQGEYFISIEHVMGAESAGSTTTKRWSEPIIIKDVINQAVMDITKGDMEVIFTPSDVISEVLKSYPTANKATIRCQLISDCVNHSSRKHYQGNKDRYYLVEKGRYRLYDEEKDGRWNEQGERI